MKCWNLTRLKLVKTPEDGRMYENIGKKDHYILFPVASTWIIGYTWSVSFHFSLLILDSR
jgi:hypothetical protein